MRNAHKNSPWLLTLKVACAIDDQISLIDLYYDLGVRWMLVAYNRNNRAGGGL